MFLIISVCSKSNGSLIAVKFIALERLLQVAKAHLAIYKVSLAIKIDLLSNHPTFTN